jgi:BASS family bile acid:Na+ symporter
MVILAGSSAVVSPLLLQGLLPLVASGKAARIDPFGMMSALLITQLLPLLLGLLVRHRRPQLAERLLGPFELASKVLNLSAAGLILATQFQMLVQIHAWLRRHAHPAGRQPGHRLARRRTGNR